MIDFGSGPHSLLATIYTSEGKYRTSLEMPDEASILLNMKRGDVWVHGIHSPNTSLIHGLVCETMVLPIEQMRQLREERNLMLISSDWTQMPDAPLSDAARAAWREYRQALRDLPETATDVTNPAWPMPPET